MVHGPGSCPRSALQPVPAAQCPGLRSSNVGNLARSHLLVNQKKGTPSKQNVRPRRAQYACTRRVVVGRGEGEGRRDLRRAPGNGHGGDWFMTRGRGKDLFWEGQGDDAVAHCFGARSEVLSRIQPKPRQIKTFGSVRDTM